jgi:hypothetical protein
MSLKLIHASLPGRSFPRVCTINFLPLRGELQVWVRPIDD